MSGVVSRTCAEIPEDGQDRDARSRPLEEYRDLPAYVLLGDPGSGKTTAFERERGAPGADAIFVSARDFLVFAEAHPEWGKGTLFIDGLDEVRAGSSDARTPLDRIRRRLEQLGRPRFRLSCRAADWLGASDRTKLAALSPDGRVTVLQLDPLADSDVETILKAHPRVGDPRGFVRAARERRVDGFLANPQSLHMLAEVVGGGGSWPASRAALFEAACREMAREHNPEHLAAAGAREPAPVCRDGPGLEDVLDAAGRLCAVQLVAGADGYALTAHAENGDLPSFDRCAREWDEVGGSAAGGARLLRTALATKLFRAGPDGGVRPAHRHVAEFLGARHVARLVQPGERGRGLPVSRVLALISGGDGVVVTPLRGLSAWLAALCPAARRDLVERDPIGVGLYGDVSGFSTGEKRELLAVLGNQTFQHFPASGTAAAFAPLATPAMEPAFRDALTGPGLKDRPAFARFALRVLAHGSRLPNLSSTLLEIVRDGAWGSDVNTAALDAFIWNREDGREKTIGLRRLLDAVHAGRVADPDDELRGTLLTALHPDALSPSEVWSYCSPPSDRVFGRYFRFLARTLAERCSDVHVAEHLDALAVRRGDADPLLECFFLKDLPVDLLARGLEAHGADIETKRLYDWLGVGLDSTGSEYPQAGAGPRRIRAWLERHPEIQKSVFAEGLRRAAAGPGPLRISARDVWLRLYGSALPGDFGLWCLRRAEAASDRRVAEYLLERAFGSVCERKGDDGLSADVLIERARAHPVLAGVFTELSVCRVDDDHYSHYRESARLAQRSRDGVRRRRQRWIAHVRACEDALRANRGAPALLHQIAAAYHGLLTEAEGGDPRARLGSLFFEDDGLVETALTALRDVVDRSDAPGVDEIVGLRGRNREHYLALPFLTGLAERERTAPDVPLRLDGRQTRTALAFFFHGVSQDEPAWYRRLLVSDPELVADVLVRCAASALRRGEAHVPGLEALARDEKHARVAGAACLRLLRSFPVRCAAPQLVALNHLLRAALRHADHGSFTALIERKVSRTGMSVAQRARWLAAGFVLSPERFSDRLREFARHGERRVRGLAAFLGDEHDAVVWLDRLETAGLEMLVRLLGASFGPCDWPSGGSGRVTPAMEVSDHVERMIGRLAESPTAAAGAALDALVSDESLVPWRGELTRAGDRQRVIRRDAAWRSPEVEQVCRTLKNGPPANAADLAALVTDRLDEVAERIRTGNDNGWRPYWNEGKDRRAAEPKHEDSCRDALLGDLRRRLPPEVDPQPEGRYANDGRADLRVACGDFQIPVEIKKHCHPKLWSALRDQLIVRYITDPATGGYGIYLVLWFGETPGRRVPPPSSGSRPGGPEELKARLEAVLTPEEARRVSVRVIDVSGPAPAAARSPAGVPRSAGVIDVSAPAPAAGAVSGRTGASESAR